MWWYVTSYYTKVGFTRVDWQDCCVHVVICNYTSSGSHLWSEMLPIKYDVNWASKLIFSDCSVLHRWTFLGCLVGKQVFFLKLLRSIITTVSIKREMLLSKIEVRTLRRTSNHNFTILYLHTIDCKDQFFYLLWLLFSFENI